ncbi:MAG: GNAT family N-acetyltransferase [Spirochaetae bacterium HGW-Spirochaetae-8]|nr:MAG: GNAT family N-acetyltransferase [Spirochaetae bacterium HGW-Spirochaetae-8]
MRTILETERLILRELVIDDATQLSRVLCDPISMGYYPRPKTPREVVTWIEKNIERYATEGFGLWAVTRKSDGAFIGDCGITLQHIDQDVLPEVGYHIIKEYCLNGYATEAARGCLDFGFGKLKLAKIYSYTREDNIPSRRGMEKAGLKMMKTFENHGIPTVVYMIENHCV